MGFVFDPSDPEPDYVTAFLDDEDFVEDFDPDENDEHDWDAVETAPRRASTGPTRDGTGPRSRMTSMAPVAVLFVGEPGGFGLSSAASGGPTGRPTELSPVSRARVIEVLEESAGGVSIERMRLLMRPGGRTRSASDDYERLASAVACLRKRRRIRVDHLAEVLGCDPATVWRLKKRGESQLQDSGDLYVGTDAQLIAA